ncbi:hypothetical protein [Streptomonospora arabica]|uniref:Uncharacterized protein n=1 Tax=Streptomonospora arabica TaxID=412417 RepID=A0ABV9SHF7_9ACTN
MRRVGDPVHRPATAAAPALHRLLRHLRREAFECPEPLGSDERDTEKPTCVRGDVHGRSRPLRSGARLVSAAVLLRRLRDTGAAFATGARGPVAAAAPVAAEVTCHGDAAPYNRAVRKRS